jgi:hypothetical protein
LLERWFIEISTELWLPSSWLPLMDTLVTLWPSSDTIVLFKLPFGGAAYVWPLIVTELDDVPLVWLVVALTLVWALVVAAWLEEDVVSGVGGGVGLSDGVGDGTVLSTG